MKILQIHKYYSKKRGGGSVSAFFETKSLLERRGNEVVVFAMDDPTNEPSAHSQYFASHFDLRTMTLWQKILHIPKTLYNRDAANKLDELLTVEKPDIAHVHNIYHYLTPSIFPVLKKHKIPVVFKLSDYHAICPNYKLFAHGKIDDSCRHKKFYKLFTNRSINNSRAESFVGMIEGYLNRLIRAYEYVDLFLAPSVFMQKICGEHGISQDKIVVLRNVLDLNAYQRTFEKKKYILYMGRLAEEKGILTLLQAIQLLVRQEKMNGHQCIIAGHGPEEERLQQYVKDNDLGKHIHFVGFCKKGTQQWEDLQKYAAANILPSIWYDNSPIAISEAMAFGTPVIVSDRGGTKEMIEEGKSGLLYEAENVADLADKIEVLITDETLSREMRREARERVTQLNNEEKYYANLMMYYGIMIKQNKQKETLPRDTNEQSIPAKEEASPQNSQKNAVVNRESSDKLLERLYKKLVGTKITRAGKTFLDQLSFSFLGGVIGAILLLLASIIAGRVLGPTQFGYFAVAFSIAQLIAFVFVAESDVALVRHIARHPKSYSLYQSATMIIFGATLFTGIIIMITLESVVIDHFAMAQGLYWTALFLAVSIALKRMVDGFLRAHSLFWQQAIARITEGLIVVGGLITLYYAATIGSYEIYALMLIVGGMGFIIVGAIALWRKRVIVWSYSRDTLIKMVRYARYGLIGMIANVTVKNLDKILVAFYLGAEIAGLYMAYFSASVVVIARVVQMIINVYFPMASAKKDIGSLFTKVSRLTALFTPIVFVGSIILMIIILFLYGEAYALNWHWIAFFACYATIHFAASLYGWLLASVSEKGYQQSNAAHFYGLTVFLSILLITLTFGTFSVELMIIALIANRATAGILQRSDLLRSLR